MHTTEQAKAYVAEWIKDITAAYERDVKPHYRHDRIYECYKAGCWLNAMLKKAGADEPTLHEVGFAHGQRSAFGDTWKWAVAYLNEYEQNKSVKDKPGIKLADEINAEVFKDFK